MKEITPKRASAPKPTDGLLITPNIWDIQAVSMLEYCVVRLVLTRTAKNKWKYYEVQGSGYHNIDT